MAVKSEILVRNFCWHLCAVKYDLCMMKLEQDDRSSGTWTGKLGGLRFSSACLPWKARRNALDISIHFRRAALFSANNEFGL